MEAGAGTWWNFIAEDLESKRIHGLNGLTKGEIACFVENIENLFALFAGTYNTRLTQNG